MELTAGKAAEIRALGCPVLLLKLPGVQRIVPLKKELTSIGNDTTCDLNLAMKDLDGRHAVVQKRGKSFEIFALSAQHDTLKNGVRIEASLLTNGDEIRMGDFFAVYLDPQSEVMPSGYQILSLPLDFLRQQALLEFQQARTAKTEDFNTLLYETLKSSPWFLISGGFHALIYMLLLVVIDPTEALPDKRPVIAVDVFEEDLDDEELDVFDIVEAEPRRRNRGTSRHRRVGRRQRRECPGR